MIITQNSIQPKTTTAYPSFLRTWMVWYPLYLCLLVVNIQASQPTKNLIPQATTQQKILYHKLQRNKRAKTSRKKVATSIITVGFAICLIFLIYKNRTSFYIGKELPLTKIGFKTKTIGRETSSMTDIRYKSSTTEHKERRETPPPSLVVTRNAPSENVNFTKQSNSNSSNNLFNLAKLQSTLEFSIRKAITEYNKEIKLPIDSNLLLKSLKEKNINNAADFNKMTATEFNKFIKKKAPKLFIAIRKKLNNSKYTSERREIVPVQKPKPTIKFTNQGNSNNIPLIRCPHRKVLGIENVLSQKILEYKVKVPQRSIQRRPLKRSTDVTDDYTLKSKMPIILMQAADRHLFGACEEILLIDKKSYRPYLQSQINPTHIYYVLKSLCNTSKKNKGELIQSILKHPEAKYIEEEAWRSLLIELNETNIHYAMDLWSEILWAKKINFNPFGSKKKEKNIKGVLLRAVEDVDKSDSFFELLLQSLSGQSIGLELLGEIFDNAYNHNHKK